MLDLKLFSLLFNSCNSCRIEKSDQKRNVPYLHGQNLIIIDLWFIVVLFFCC